MKMRRFSIRVCTSVFIASLHARAVLFFRTRTKSLFLFVLLGFRTTNCINKVEQQTKLS